MKKKKSERKSGETGRGKRADKRGEEDEGEGDERREVRAVTSGAALIGSRERGPFLCNL